MSWFLVTWIAWTSCPSWMLLQSKWPEPAKPLLCAPEYHHERFEKQDDAVAKVLEVGRWAYPAMDWCQDRDRCWSKKIAWRTEAKIK